MSQTQESSKYTFFTCIIQHFSHGFLRKTMVKVLALWKYSHKLETKKLIRKITNEDS